MARPFSLVQIFCIVSFFVVCCTLAVAQGQLYEGKEELSIVSAPYRSPLKNQNQFDMVSYTWALRIGAGYAVSLIDFEYSSNEYDILRETSENGYDNFAMNVEIKFALPVPFDKFSFGAAIDYNIFSIDDIKVRALDANDALITFSKDDVTQFHVLSFLAFMEYRHPISVGDTWISPYGRFGIGVNLNNSTKDNVLSVQQTTLALMIAIGVEYQLSQQMSIFFEPRWHYNNANFALHTDTNKFSGEMDLMNLSFLVGVNFYFGLGKSI